MNNFNELVKRILESTGALPGVTGNLAGSGGSLGSFQTSGWVSNPAGTPGTDEFAKNDFRKPVALGAKKGKKIKIQRRPLIRGGL